MDRKQEFTKALQIGTVCIFSYLASYYMRNLLGVSTPAMLATGRFTKEVVGTLSSVYFLIYAVGQLINGVLGDRIKSKWMVFWGLVVCGVASAAFAFTGAYVIQLLLFAIMGFALSMLRGPLVKIISENTIPTHARICCVFLSFASFAGPLIASLFAMVFDWQLTFIVAGISCIVIALCAYTVLTVLEKKNIISVILQTEKKEKKNVWGIFKLEHFVFYMFIGTLVEISAASIGFWLPTYLTEHLAFNEDIANAIFSGISMVRSLVPFVALVILKFFKEDDVRMVKYAFLTATVFFVGVWLVSNRYINVIFFLLALVAVSCASALLWSVYIPKQGKTGMVSTVNGVLDFSGYAAASVANMVFSFTVDRIGWNGIIVMWILLMASGVAAGVLAGRKGVIRR